GSGSSRQSSPPATAGLFADSVSAKLTSARRSMSLACPGSSLRGPQRRQVGALIVLFTDFGLHGPHTGQMRAVLLQMVPGTSVVDLFADAPVGNPKASAYLLAVYAAWFPVGTVFLGVVDPGRRRGAPARHSRGRRPLVCRPGQRLVRTRPTPRQRGAQLADRLGAREPFGQFSPARPLCTGRGPARTRGGAPRPALPG